MVQVCNRADAQRMQSMDRIIHRIHRMEKYRQQHTFAQHSVSFVNPALQFVELLKLDEVLVIQQRVSRGSRILSSSVSSSSSQSSRSASDTNFNMFFNPFS